MGAKKILLEIILLLASVIVFRGLWLLLDKAAVMKTSSGLAVLLVSGLAVTAIVLYLFHKEEE